MTRRADAANGSLRRRGRALFGLLPELAKNQAEHPYDQHGPRPEADHVEPGGCTFCFNSCSALFHLRDRQLVRVTGNPADPVTRGRVCPKVQFLVQLHQNKRRLTRPLKRIGERGEGRFAPISWDTALDELAEKLDRLRREYGSEALALFLGTRTGALTSHGYSQVFAEMWGTHNKTTTDPYCGASGATALRLTQGFAGGANAFTETDLGSATFYLCVGENMAETRPVYFGLINDCRLRNGARMVTIDPRLSATAAMSDEWLPIRPGTDMALALAMLHHVFANDLIDHWFCETWVEGWQTIRDFVLERAYTPEWAEPITGIPASRMHQLAADFARAERAVIFGDRGLNQHANGTQTVRCFLMLCAVTGQYGRPGSGYMTIASGIPFGAHAPVERRPPARPGLRRSPTGWLDAMLTGRPHPLRGLLMTANPMSLWPDQNRAREALRSLDVIAHCELFLNESSAFADYVFPAATGIEVGDVNRFAEDRRFVWIDKQIEPPGDARPDSHFWIELGKRFGFDDVLKDEYHDPAVFWDAMMIPDEAVRGVTVARMRRSPYRWVRAPLPTEEAAEIETLFTAGSTYLGTGKRFPTRSGKLELWTRCLEEQFRQVGLSALPEFYTDAGQLMPLPHLEYLSSDAEEGVRSPFYDTYNTRGARIVAPEGDHLPGAFDLELVTGRPSAAHFHSWTHWLWQAQEMWPDLFVQIHPDAAAPRGIADGDRVTVQTAHGRIDAVAWVRAGIRRECVFVPIGWGERQPFHPWQSVNFLTGSDERCPISEQTNLKTTLCRVSKRGRGDIPRQSSGDPTGAA